MRREGTMPFEFIGNEKFSLIAVDDCYNHIKQAVKLADGTWLLPKMPAALDDQWVRWIGEIRAESLKGADLIILRAGSEREAGDRRPRARRVVSARA